MATRKPAPADGLLVETTTTTILVPLTTLRHSGLEVVERSPTRDHGDELSR